MQSYVSTPREQSSQWKAFSRKNMQQVKTKLKNIRSSNYVANPNFMNFEENTSKELKKIKVKMASLVCRSLEPKKRKSSTSR